MCMMTDTLQENLSWYHNKVHDDKDNQITTNKSELVLLTICKNILDHRMIASTVFNPLNKVTIWRKMTIQEKKKRVQIQQKLEQKTRVLPCNICLEYIWPESVAGKLFMLSPIYPSLYLSTFQLLNAYWLKLLFTTPRPKLLFATSWSVYFHRRIYLADKPETSIESDCASQHEKCIRYN